MKRSTGDDVVELDVDVVMDMGSVLPLVEVLLVLLFVTLMLLL